MLSLRAGDIVECIVDQYTWYRKGQRVKILDANVSEATGSYIIKLPNDLSPTGYGWYLACNFRFVRRGNTKENTAMAYERTKYFVAVVNELESTPTFLVPEVATVGPLRDTKSEALKDAETRIRGDDAGKKLVILQTIAMIQEADPRPPLKITEYK